MENNSIFYDISLEYLKNSKFSNLKKKINKKNNKISSKDKRFYKKRIINVTNQLLLDKFTEKENFQEIQNSFNNYIKILISHFKLIDKNELLQEEYKDIIEETYDNNDNICKDMNINNDKINKLCDCDNAIDNCMSLLIRSDNKEDEYSNRSKDNEYENQDKVNNEENEDNYDNENKCKRGIENIKIISNEELKKQNMLYIDSINNIFMKDKKNTLDNFVIKKSNGEVIDNSVLIPTKKKFNLKDPKFKNKGIHKKNISINYEEREKVTNKEEDKEDDKTNEKKTT